MIGNRNDFVILVDAKNQVWLAQGTPAADKLPRHAAIEGSLYYSQLKHRAVWLENDWPVIGLPRLAPAGAFMLGSVHWPNCHGTPQIIGRLQS